MKLYGQMKIVLAMLSFGILTQYAPSLEVVIVQEKQS